MKIISTKLHDRYYGIIRAIPEIFERAAYWLPEVKPVFDVFDEIQPDIVFCDLKYVNQSFIAACQEYENIKIVLFGDSVPRGFNPHLVCSKPSLSPLMKKHLETQNRV